MGGIWEGFGRDYERKGEIEARKEKKKGWEDKSDMKHADMVYVGSMEKSYEQYSPHLMHTILLQYKPGVRGSGFRALAKKYNIKAGHVLISKWYRKWDGSESSLKKQSGGDVRSILTQKEKKKHVADFIEKSSKKEAVTYTEVKKNVELKTKKSPALRTVQDYGSSAKMTSKKRKRVLKSEGLFIYSIP